MFFHHKERGLLIINIFKISFYNKRLFRIEQIQRAMISTDQVNVKLSYEIINDLSDFISLNVSSIQANSVFFQVIIYKCQIIKFEPVGKWFEQYTFLKHQGDEHVEEGKDYALFLML